MKNQKKYKKLLIVNLIIYFIFFININTYNSNKIKRSINGNIKKTLFFYLKNKPSIPSSLLIQKEKKHLLEIISKIIGKKLDNIRTLFLSSNFNFGNQILLINSIIFFCEILGCKRIILDKNYNWFIKKKIFYRKFNLIISVDSENKYRGRNTIFENSSFFFYYAKYIKPDLRINVIKKEILKNIPKYNTNPNHLFIYIRSGDIFIKGLNSLYSQPPLCFYKKIIENNNYEKIFIISKVSNNPVIKELLQQYPNNIIFQKNNLKKDIGLLISAYSIVGAVSTFINIIIRLNDNLKIYYDYNIDSLIAKINHFHHLFYKLPKKINIIKMEPSDKYLNEMKKWTNSKYQRNLMLNEICTNNLVHYNL